MTLTLKENTLRPLLLVDIRPELSADQDRLAVGLQHLTAKDPTLEIATEFGADHTVLRGMDELHLETAIGRLINEFNVAARFDAPHVAYRGAIDHETKHSYTHERRWRGDVQVARVTLTLTPKRMLNGFLFENQLGPDDLPSEHINSVEKGILSVTENHSALSPVFDMKIALVDASTQAGDSHALAFEVAARMCLKEGMRKAGTKILEPIMKVEVISPGEFTDGIIGDLISRRGSVQGQQARGKDTVIDAFVPLATLFGYPNSVRSLSSGHAKFTMKFDHYAPVPTCIDPDDTTPASMAKRA